MVCFFCLFFFLASNFPWSIVCAYTHRHACRGWLQGEEEASQNTPKYTRRYKVWTITQTDQAWYESKWRTLIALCTELEHAWVWLEAAILVWLRSCSGASACAAVSIIWLACARQPDNQTGSSLYRSVRFHFVAGAAGERAPVRHRARARTTCLRIADKIWDVGGAFQTSRNKAMRVNQDNWDV